MSSPPQLRTSVWGLHAPAATPVEVRRVVRAAVAEAMRDPEMLKPLAASAYEPIASTPEDHQAQSAALVSRWLGVGKNVNLKE